MPVLTNADRTSVGAAFQSDASLRRDALGAVTKSDIQAAIAAVDDWVVANQSSYNTAIPLPARTALTAAQKAQLLLYVVKRRFESGV